MISRSVKCPPLKVAVCLWEEEVERLSSDYWEARLPKVAGAAVL